MRQLPISILLASSVVRDPLDTAPPGQAPDDRLCDSLDVVAENLAVPLHSTLAQSLSH